MPHENLMRHSPAPPPFHPIFPQPTPSARSHPEASSYGKFSPLCQAAATTKKSFTLLAPKR